MRKSLATLALCACTLVIAAAQDLSPRIYDAVRTGDASALRTLIPAKAPDVRDSRGNTPLLYTAAVGNLATMRTLIDAGADVNAKNAFDITPLMLCATDESKVRLLISKGADVNARSKQGRTPLLIAAATEGNSVVVRLLLDKGADISKAQLDPPTTPLAVAAEANDLSTVRMLIDHGANTAGPFGEATLINAATHGNIGMMELLLSRGVSVNATTPAVLEKPGRHGDLALGLLTPLILAVSYSSPEAVKLLLDHKAEVNRQDVRGMTPLMLALALDHPNVRVVRMLLEQGADPKVKSKAGETALDWARKFNNPEILKAFDAAPMSIDVAFNVSPATPAQAVQKSINLLQRTSASFFVESGCPSCHAQNLTSMALSIAGAAGMKIDAPATADRLQQSKLFWAPQEQTLMLRMDAPGGHIMTSFGVLQFAADGIKAGPTTDAMVHNLAAQQQVAGNWHIDGIARPPMMDGDFTPTAVAIRSLSVYSIPARATELSARIAKGANWLRTASPVTAEDYNMQLLGLKWAGTSQAALQPMLRRIASLQHSDGGWAQTPYLGSDAYATGQTLYAMKELGVPANDPGYRRGAQFLVKTQLEDGSWHVASRAPKFQPYFQSGFPHDHDQWISMSATAWATMALAQTLPQPSLAAR